MLTPDSILSLWEASDREYPLKEMWVFALRAFFLAEQYRADYAEGASGRYQSTLGVPLNCRVLVHTPARNKQSRSPADRRASRRAPAHAARSARSGPYSRARLSIRSASSYFFRSASKSPNPSQLRYSADRGAAHHRIMTRRCGARPWTCKSCATVVRCRDSASRVRTSTSTSARAEVSSARMIFKPRIQVFAQPLDDRIIIKVSQIEEQRSDRIANMIFQQNDDAPPLPDRAAAAAIG